jgi:large-conductance mechanosensitive channel
MKGSYILSGFIGALILILVLFAITVWLKPFNYQEVYIVNPKIVISDSLKTDSQTCSQIAVLQDLESKGVLLTPQEYTSHIVDYYNTLIGFLIGLFVLFSFVSFFSIKNTAQKDIEEAKTKMKEDFEKAKETTKKELIDDLKDSQSFISSLIEKIIGHIEDDLVTKTDKELVDKNLEEIAQKQVKMEENINLLFNEVDAKSEIKE